VSVIVKFRMWRECRRVEGVVARNRRVGDGHVRADAVFSCYVLLGVDVYFGENDTAGRGLGGGELVEHGGDGFARAAPWKSVLV